MLMKSTWALCRQSRCLLLGAEVLIVGQIFHFSQRHFSQRAAVLQLCVQALLVLSLFISFIENAYRGAISLCGCMKP